MLAQMLQMQFDREFDDQLRREEKKFNGDSKGKNLVESKVAEHPGSRSPPPPQCPSPSRTSGWFILMKTARVLRTRWTGRTPDTTPTEPVSRDRKRTQPLAIVHRLLSCSYRNVLLAVCVLLREAPGHPPQRLLGKRQEHHDQT